MCPHSKKNRKKVSFFFKNKQELSIKFTYYIVVLEPEMGTAMNLVIIPKLILSFLLPDGTAHRVNVYRV